LPQQTKLDTDFSYHTVDVMSSYADVNPLEVTVTLNYWLSNKAEFGLTWRQENNYATVYIKENSNTIYALLKNSMKYLNTDTK